MYNVFSNFDNYLTNGLKPIVELSFMPAALANRTDEVGLSSGVCRQSAATRRFLDVTLDLWRSTCGRPSTHMSPHVLPIHSGLLADYHALQRHYIAAERLFRVGNFHRAVHEPAGGAVRNCRLPAIPHSNG